ncbi:MAG: VOC family protein [Chloroflexi bacterium]|nr:MAG: VOC family protein [Chloroflexota bacterium]
MKSTTSPTIAPWLSVRDATRAVEYYRAAFGAVEVYRLAGDDGAIAVAQLSIGGAMFWVQNDVAASRDGRVTGSVRIILSVDDPDSVFERAVAGGATIRAAMHEEYGWRTGRVTDPFGHDWELSKQLAPA